MEVIRYNYIFILLLVVDIVLPINNNAVIVQEKTHNCPFTRIIEDIFKYNNKTSDPSTWKKDNDRTKLLVNSISNTTSTENNTNKLIQEELVNDIIASIKRIKENVTAEENSRESYLNEAIILNVPTGIIDANNEADNNGLKILNQIKENSEEKSDIENPKNVATKIKITKRDDNVDIDINKNTKSDINKTEYVEILTVEPNNTSINNSSSSNKILDVLKQIMPMFNNSITKELHSITIIERNQNKNQSFSETKNISTVVVKYCDKSNDTFSNDTSNFKRDVNDTLRDDDLVETDNTDYEDAGSEKKLDNNWRNAGYKNILEAAEYGMQKMHELYGVLEPKLYSMGFWLDDKNPARYVAAFNAPSEDMAKYSRYGYATLQAATKLKQLNGAEDELESRTDEAGFPAATALRQSPLLDECPLKGPPKCPPASKRYRTHDGTCNNLSRLRWGSTMTPVQRFLPPSYSDDLQAPRRSVFGNLLPSAREISSLIHEDHNVENPGITHLLMQWGQFLDHDVTSSSQSRGFNGSVPRCCKDGGRDFIPKEFLHPECMPIIVPESDPFYGPRGIRCLDFVRSSPGPRDDCALGWREQMNQVSAYIDGSPLYASSARQSDKLRLFRNGMLQYGRVQQRRPLLPREHRDELCRGGAVSTDCFKSGDARVNEHPGLVAAHIVWLRQHNRMAQELAHLNPHWSDEKIYQETRKIVGAMVQHITYREFLPVVLGSEVMRLFELEPLRKGYYKDYNPKINPSPSSSFGSAAFRFGHSLVQSSMVRYDRFHRPMNNNVSLHDELTNPSNIWSMGAVDRLLLGMLNQPSQRRDEFITEELTNHLFQTPHFDFGMDLAAINIQRGRDHGVPAYTTWREPCGLTPIVDFDDLMRVMPMRVVRKLKVLYRHVDDIDLFTGGMAERPVVGGLVGPTFACIIAQQFSNLRKGDRFWYENGGFESSFTPAQLQQVRRISLAQVLCRTLDTIDSIQPFAFLSPNNPDNERISCLNGLLNDFDLSPWIEINTDSNNIRKSDIDEPELTERPKPTTTVKPTTKKPPKGTLPTHKLVQNKPHTDSDSTKSKNLENFNNTDTTFIDETANKTDIKTDSTNVNVTKPNVAQPIDDKLDFKNKSRRYDDIESNGRYNRPAQYNDYDDEVQSVQSLVINNLQNKRPHNRPYITVTENVDKYTYLINYVPRPTQSWRPTTRRNTDRDVVKVTYQNYDDTYRRPNRPYYNRHEYNNDDVDSRNNRPTPMTDFESRSNDETTSTTKTPDPTKSNTITSTTENLYKLVTFGYIGTYKGDMTNDQLKSDSLTKTDSKHETVSKDFDTFDTKPDDTDKDDKGDMTNTGKLSTFILYDTATKPYNTRRRHDEQMNLNTNRYYYLGNVLHKYSDNDSPATKKDSKQNDKTKTTEFFKDSSTKPSATDENLQERSVSDKIESFEELESKSADPDKTRSKVKKPSGAAKTPSVAFQIIPSENSPSQWAVYEEKDDLPEGLPHTMPIINVDPYALREVPRPMDLTSVKRRPFRFNDS